MSSYKNYIIEMPRNEAVIPPLAGSNGASTSRGQAATTNTSSTTKPKTAEKERDSTTDEDSDGE